MLTLPYWTYVFYDTSYEYEISVHEILWLCSLIISLYSSLFLFAKRVGSWHVCAITKLWWSLYSISLSFRHAILLLHDSFSFSLCYLISLFLLIKRISFFDTLAIHTLLSFLYFYYSPSLFVSLSLSLSLTWFLYFHARSC